MNQQEAGKKVLLFGFDDLTGILALKSALDPFGAELVPVGRSDYGKTLAVLAGLEESPEEWEESSVSPRVLGRMAVLCELSDRLDDLLPVLNRAGAGKSCLKAILTPHNRNWTAARLYRELSAEDAAIRAQSGQ